MSWTRDLQFPKREQDPLPAALINKLLRGMKYHERFSSVMAAQAYRVGRGTLALLVTQRGEFTQCAIAGVLTAELLERKGYGQSTDGNLLVVTHAVTKQIKAIETLGMDDLKLAEIWTVASFSKYHPIVGDKPSIAVTNPGWIVKESTLLPRIAVAVIDATHPRTFKMLPQIYEALKNVRLRVLLMPPDEAALSLLDADATTWLWDPVAERDTTVHFSTKSSVQLLPARILGPRKLLLCEDDPQFDAALLASRRGLMQVMGTGSAQEIVAAWGIYHRLRQLALPLPEYEQAARHSWPGLTLSEQLSQIKDAEFARATQRAAWLNAVEALHSAYEILRTREEPAKFYALAQRLEHLLTQGSQLLTIVAPSRTELPLLRQALISVSSVAEQAEKDGYLEFLSAGDEERLATEGERRQSLLSGSRMSRRTYLDAYALLQPEIVLYPHEVPMELAVQKRYYQALESWQSIKSRRTTLAHLELLCDQPPEQNYPRCEKPACVVTSLDNRPINMARFLEAAQRLNLDILAQVDTKTWFTPQTVMNRHMEMPTNVRGRQMLLHFTSGNSVAVMPEQRFPVFSLHSADGNSELRLIEARALRPGQQLVLMVDDVYSSLFDRLIEALGRRTTLIERTLLNLWQEAKKAALIKYKGSRADLYQDLLHNGLTVEYSTVLTWLRDTENFEQADPQQFHDFAALAQISDVYNEGQIHATFRAITAHRTRQRVAGRHLHALLRSLLTHRRSAAKYAEDLESEVAELFAAVQICTLNRVDHPQIPLRRDL